MTFRWFKATATIGILAALVWWAGAGSVWARLRDAELGWIATAFAAVTVATGLMAWRWQLVARACALEISYRKALAEYYIAQLGNTVLPGGVAGDVARALRVGQRANLKLATKSIVVERLLGQVALLTIMAVSFAVALCVPGGITWPPWAGVIVFGLAATGALAIWLQHRPNAAGRLATFVLGLCQAPEMILQSMVIAGCLLLSFYASARATGTVIPPAAWTTLIPLVLFAMVIPLSIGGWGWREGAAAALFPLIGASADAGIAAGIVYGSVLLVAAFPAGLVLLGGLGPAEKFYRRTQARHDTTHSSEPSFLSSNSGLGVRDRGGIARAGGQPSTGQLPALMAAFGAVRRKLHRGQ